MSDRWQRIPRGARLTPGRSSRLVPGMETNRISTARGTLGARLTDRDHCSACPNEAWVQLNIDGIWSYLCAGCWARLAACVADPLQAP